MYNKNANGGDEKTKKKARRKMNIIEIIRKKINTICEKYIDGKIEDDEILPIFYIAGSQTLPPPLNAEEEEITIRKLDTDEKMEARKTLVEISTENIERVAFSSKFRCKEVLLELFTRR